MKLVPLVCLVTLSFGICAGDWHYIDITKDQPYQFIAYDRDVIPTISGKSIIATFASINRSPQKKFDTVMTVCEIDCKKNQLREIQVTAYRQGLQVYANRKAESWTKANKGSMGNVMISSACTRSQSQVQIKADSLNEITPWGQQFLREFEAKGPHF